MKGLNLLVLRCRDVEAARRFYDCFGLEFTPHRHGTGPEHYASEDDSGAFELYPASPDAPADATGLGFGVADLSRSSGALLAREFAPQPAKQNPWGTTFVVRDPEGRRVEVKEVKGTRQGEHRSPTF